MILSDRFLYLIGGSDTEKGYLKSPAKPPAVSISLIALNRDKSATLLQEFSMKEDYRMYSACAFHRDSRTVYILGGYKND